MQLCVCVYAFNPNTHTYRKSNALTTYLKKNTHGGTHSQSESAGLKKYFFFFLLKWSRIPVLLTSPAQAFRNGGITLADRGDRS